MPETVATPAVNRTNRLPITDEVLNVQDFNERIVGAYNDGTAELELPADNSTLRSFIPAGTGLLRDFSYIAPEIPLLNSENCVGCMECVTECPDTAILGKIVPKAKLEEELARIPDEAEREHYRRQFGKTTKYWNVYEKKGAEPGYFGIFIDPTKCKGCAECVDACGNHGALAMLKKDEPTLKRFQRTWGFYKQLPETPKEFINEKLLSDMMLAERSLLYVGGAGSCMGCGEGTALRMMLAATGFVYGRENIGIVNSTGCSTVYASTYPYNPYLVPWTNSLFENAPADAMGIRSRWDQMGWKDKKLWVIGGDGAMLDIGFQSLSRMLASGMNIKVLVLDTQVYSNTGGQSSTASYMGQNTKFSVHGKVIPGKVERRKELAQICMMHPNTFVAQTSCAMPNHFYKAIMSANEYEGPAVVTVYTTCQPEHGVGDNMAAQQSKLAVDTRTFPVLMYDPRKGLKIAERLTLQGNPATKEDWYKNPKTGELFDFVMFARSEGRFAKHFDKDGKPTEAILRGNQERLENWRTLQELAGIILSRLKKSTVQRLKSLVPFGLGVTKPKHFRDMLRVVWKNRDNLPYAWKVISRGVCDGCALGVAGLHDWTIEGVHLCMTRLNLLRLNTMPALDPRRLEDVSALGHLDNAQLRELGRLPVPLLRERGDRGFRRISWADAYDRIARTIRASSPRRIGFFVTARGVTNEVYYMAQKVARYLGTNNVDNAARLCHSPSTGAMKYAIGVAATTCSYKDWWGTDLIIFFGANPANDQPVTTKYLHEAKKTGAKVVLVNPYLEPGMQKYWVPSSVSSALFGTDITDFWFPVTQGGDIAFLYGVIKILLANGWYDREFVEQHTRELEDLKRQADAFDFATLEEQAGLSRATMEEFAAMIHGAKNGVLVWSMGITQHAYGGDGVSMVLNLGLLKGWVGRDKCGLMPIRGHSGVQGGAEMGAYSTALPGGKPINADNAAALSRHYDFPVPDWTGLTTTEMVEAGAAGQLDLLYCLGGNFLRTLPEPEYVKQAMANIPLRVHQDIILTDQMFIEPKEAVLLLPAKTRYEQDGGGTETITERRIAFSPEIPRQVGEARAEWRILRELAAATYPDRAHLLKCDSGQAIREEIAAVVPFYDGIQRLQKTGDAVQYGGPHLCANGQFQTADGKAHFRAVNLPDLRKAAGVFEVSSRRGKQFNTLIYAEVDPLTGAARDAVFINPDDAATLHLRNSDRVALVNDRGRLEGRIFFAPIARGNLQVHWPEGNVLLRRGIVDTLGGVPDYNAQVRVEKL